MGGGAEKYLTCTYAIAHISDRNYGYGQRILDSLPWFPPTHTGCSVKQAAFNWELFCSLSSLAKAQHFQGKGSFRRRGLWFVLALFRKGNGAQLVAWSHTCTKNNVPKLGLTTGMQSSNVKVPKHTTWHFWGITKYPPWSQWSQQYDPL